MTVATPHKHTTVIDKRRSREGTSYRARCQQCPRTTGWTRFGLAQAFARAHRLMAAMR